MNQASQPLVSIVTPVYNGEEYFVECIESILAQTYQNWEYIIVNNCSKDLTLAIAREYAARDPRIRIYDNQEFLPVIANHNAALRKISPTSKYCKLVFADDWIFPDCIECMVAVAENFPSVGIVGAYVLQGTEVKSTGLPYQRTIFDGREICRRHFLDHLYVFESANAILYRSDLVRQKATFYNEKNIHADTEVCFALLKISDFGFVHQMLTYTRVRMESLRSESEDLQTHLAGTLEILRVHGPAYLNESELDRRMREHMSEYYKFLGKCLLRGRGKTLKYHKEKLIDAGVGFQWSSVFFGALVSICDLALNPGSTAKKFLTFADLSVTGAHKENEWSDPVAADTVNSGTGKISDAV